MPAITAAAARTAMMMLLPPAFDEVAFAGARTGVDATERLAAGLADAASAGAAAIEIADMATRNFENRMFNSLLFVFTQISDPLWHRNITAARAYSPKIYLVTEKMMHRTISCKCPGALGGQSL
jgi:hypothetical protein